MWRLVLSSTCCWLGLAAGQSAVVNCGTSTLGSSVVAGSTNEVEISWVIEGSKLRVRATLAQPLLEGWFAVGFAQQAGSMVPADAVIASYRLGTVTQVAMTARRKNAIAEQAQVSIGDTSALIQSGESVLHFTWPLDTVMPAGVQVKATGPTQLIYAYGLAATPGYHGPTSRGAVTIDLSHCSTQAPPPSPLPVAPTTQSQILPTLPLMPPAATTTAQMQTTGIIQAAAQMEASTIDDNVDLTDDSLLLDPLPDTNRPPQVPTGQQFCRASRDPDLDSEADLGPGVTLRWAVRGDRLRARMVVEGVLQAGWMGLGFSDRPHSMVSADAVVGLMPSGQVAEYALGGRDAGAITLLANQNHVTGSLHVANGSTVLDITRLLEPTGAAQIMTHEANFLIYAYGQGPFGFHGTTRGSTLLVFGLCPAANTTTTTPTPPPTTTTAPSTPPTQTTLPATTTSVQQAGSGCVSRPVGMDGEVVVSGMGTLRWASGKSTLTMVWVTDAPMNTGWLGLGLADRNGSMANAYAVVGTMDINSTAEYVLTQKAASGITRVTPGVILASSKLVQGNNNTSLYVQMHTDALPEATQPVGPSKRVHVVMASGKGLFGYHDNSRAALTLHLDDCSVDGRMLLPTTTSTPLPTPVETQPAPQAAVLVVSQPSPTATNQPAITPVATVTPQMASSNAAPASTCGRQGGVLGGTVEGPGGVQVRWVLEGREMRISAVFAMQPQPAWVAVGLAGSAFSMAPAVAAVGLVGENTVTEYNLTGRAPAAVTPQAVLTITNGRVSLVGTHGSNTTTIEFIYPADTTQYLQTTQPMHLIYAWGSGALSHHGPLSRGSVSVDLPACLQSPTPGPSTRSTRTHGIVMGVAWAGLVPSAIMVARFVKPRVAGGRYAATWFYLHSIMQLCAMGLTIAGLVVAVRMVDGFTAKAHQLLGIVVVGLSILLPLISIVRPAPAPKGQESSIRQVWQTVHVLLGYTACLGGLVNVGLGLQKADAPTWLAVCFYVWCALLVSTFALFTGIAWALKRKNSPRSSLTVPLKLTPSNIPLADLRSAQDSR